MTGRVSDAELLDVAEEINDPSARAEVNGNIKVAAHFLRRAVAELLALRGLACPSCGSDHVGRFDDIGAHVWFCIQHPTAPITDYFCRECNHTWNRT